MSSEVEVNYSGNTQKCSVARKDLGFELRRTIMYVEAQILSPDAANGRFSVLPAGVVELVDTRDLKSRGPQGSWGFKSPPRHQINCSRHNKNMLSAIL